MKGEKLSVTPRIEFGIPVSASWSSKKKIRMHGMPHQNKPDIDNLLKAVFDALLPDDSVIHSIQASKVWSQAGWIRIEEIEE